MTPAFGPLAMSVPQRATTMRSVPRADAHGTIPLCPAMSYLDRSMCKYNGKQRESLPRYASDDRVWGGENCTTGE